MTATDEERDDTYRAVGRWVVEFSRLIFIMRLRVIRYVTPEGDQTGAMLALGEATARQIADAFFAICVHSTPLTADEAKVAKRLKRDVVDQISRRNDFTHGDWWVGYPTHADKEGGPMLHRVKPGRASGASRVDDMPVETLDEMSDELHELRQHVAEFGDYCLHQGDLLEVNGQYIRVKDIFTLGDEGVARDGPLATAFKRQYY